MAGRQEQEEYIARFGNARGRRVDDQRVQRKQEGQAEPRRPRDATLAKQLIELVDSARHEKGRDDACREPRVGQGGPERAQGQQWNKQDRWERAADEADGSHMRVAAEENVRRIRHQAQRLR